MAAMRKDFFSYCALSCAVAAGCAIAAAQASAQTPVTLTIQADKPVHAVSPTLYGLMTEEINYAFDGGLYAEMVRNRTFRGDWSGLLDWYLVEKGDAAAKIAPDHGTGPSTALPGSLKIEVTRASAQSQAGVLNTGWWGMALRPDTSYKGSFYAKTGAEIGPVTVSLVNDKTGKAVATAQVTGVGTDWKQFPFTLKTGAVEPSTTNHLEITVGKTGMLWLQLVSLFPPTYHEQQNGRRVDLMEKMAAMHPQFLRFPGGNYLEGNRIADWYDWKKTIGPLVDRPTHPSPWGYQSSDGLGLLEFLGWCEDLKMQPVLAVYAGYSLGGQHVEPGEKLETYVQSALDELEYVTGSTSTKWGAVRAQNGHPEPFKLTYVEIGNEEWFDKSGSYDARYTQFLKAIKTKYPDLQLIATAPVKSAKPDVIDEHFYVRATENFRTATNYDPHEGSEPVTQHWENGRYDKADRNGPKIFVGEWATREGSPTPNMGAALGDAAWMTGLERNSDLVIMASYAPLLVNVNPGGMQWATDLIGYDALTSYGSPAYYAQVLFGSYLGDQVLASKASGVGEKFFYSITGSAAKKKLYLKLVNASSDPQAIDMAIDGAKTTAKAKLIALSAADTQETNSITDPKRIAPVESAISLAGGRVRHTMPRYSIEVVEIDLQ
jgi:alpha-N-arabinofuranosidase